MHLQDVLASLARRWYLALAGIFLSVGLVLLTFTLVHPTYEAKASVVLLPPKATVTTGSNPYLQLSNLAPTLDLLSVALSDQETAQEIAQLSPTAEYTAKADPTSSAPILVVSVSDQSAARAQAVLDRLLTKLPRELASLQLELGVSSRASITPAVVAADSRPEKVGKDQLRAAIVAGGAGLVGSALLIALWDGRRMRGPRVVIAEESTEEALDEAVLPPNLRRFGRGRGRTPVLTPTVEALEADWSWENPEQREDVAVSSSRGA